MSTTYLQTNLVSDIEGLATITDPELMDPFGLANTSTSPFWIANNVTDTSTLYAVTGVTGTNVTKTDINPPSAFVAIPTTASGNQGPTGVVANTDTSSFLVGNGGNGASAHFIFDNDNGTISAWDTGSTAFIQATTVGADYTGLAINQAQTLLYAANNAGTGSINVFNSSFAPVSLGAGAFATPAAISALGLNPFNVQDINGSVYVTYALPGDPQNHAALGEGAVAIFTETGALIQTIVGGVLSSPWGVALAPAGFGQFGGDLLVANESYINSEINAFNPVTGTFEGTIPINVGSGNTPGGLWALEFGTGGNNGSPNTLYFTDGINGENDGLFGAITSTSYVQTNLVSDIAGLAAITDTELMNPFGFSYSSTSPIWISDNNTQTSTLYAVTGITGTNVTKTVINPPSGFVAIPTTASGTASGNQGPTGQVNNTNTSSFLVENGGNGASAHFIFANDNGTISAWDTGPTAFIQVTTPGADYSGLAINQAQTLLYAADTAGGSIHVFNSSFQPVNPGTGGLVANAFATPAAISALGLNPFNVQDINGSVYVTYALPGNPQNDAAPGEGAVAVFGESGTLLQTIVGGQLASPWGIALAPADFGQFGGDLLVANESYASSVINAFNPVTGAFEGSIPIDVGSGNTPGGLWAIGFGIGGNNGSPNTLYFTDGINQQADGLFGAITVVPTPPYTAAQINTIYQEVLQRPAATAEQNLWVTAEANGQVTADQVLSDIVTSAEAVQFVYPIIRLYQASFDRVPDQAGLAGWVNTFESGAMTEAQIAQAFVNSPEFASHYATTQLSAFVSALYTNVLGRPALPGEISAWVNSGLSASQILTGFSDSAEFQNDTRAAIIGFLDAAANGTESYHGPLV